MKVLHLILIVLTLTSFAASFKTKRKQRVGKARLEISDFEDNEAESWNDFDDSRVQVSLHNVNGKSMTFGALAQEL